MKLAEGSLTPLYQQVMDDIKDDIEHGVYHANDKIPSEAELSGMYEVSRITIRRAIEELVGEGYLTKRQGKGTFVNPPKLACKLVRPSAVQSFTDTCLECGRLAGAHVIAVTPAKATPDECELLGLKAGSELVRLRRVRTADGVPVMVEDLLLPLARHGYLLREDLEDVSVNDVLERRAGVRCATGRGRTIEMVRADAELSELLSVARGEPLFYVNGLMLDATGAPLMVERQHIVASLFVISF